MLDRDALLDAYALPDRTSALVRMNFVMSLDGAVTIGGHSGGLGDENDQQVMGILRTLCDVVLVGAGTVRAEGYGGIRLRPANVQWRRENGLTDQPRIAVVSSALELDPRHQFFTDAVTRPIVLTHADAPAQRRAALADVADVVVCGEHAVDPVAMVDALAGDGLPQILCEGGPGLFGTLIEADLVDELCLSLSPLLVAGSAGRIARAPLEVSRRMRLLHAIPADDLLLLRYARAAAG
jgi:riboflavin biosynthesis pyrimidine reductase